MNTGKINIIVVLMLATLALPSPVIYAASYEKDNQEGSAQAGKKMEARRQEFYRDLNLSEDQKKLLEENKKARREEMRSLFSQMKEKREAIRNELQRDELNIGKITQINDELKILSAQMLDHRLEGILEVRKILTPEQFKKFMMKVGQRQERFKEKKD